MISTLVGKAALAVRQDASILAFEGTVRSGKTVASLLKWLRYVRNGPAGALLMTGKTERTIKQNLVDPLIAMLGPDRCRFVSGSGELYLLGRKVYIAGANDEGSVTKIQGLTLAGAYVDETATLPESFFNMLYSRLSIAGAKLFLTSNPAGPAHWLKVNWLNRAKLWIDRDGRHHHNPDGLDLVRVSFKLEDNPNLPAEYVARTKASYTGLWYRRYILGEWVAAEGAIYDMWDPDCHVVPELPEIARWLACGIDYGTTNPTHAVLLGLGADGLLYIAAEHRHDSRITRRSLSDSEYSEWLQDWLDTVPVPGQSTVGVRPERVIVDPSAKSFYVQLYRDRMQPVGASNSVIDGIRTVGSLLSRRQLRVHASCTELIAEIPGYSWDDKAAAKGDDKPVKLNDHGVDALRYAIYTTMGTWRNTLALPLAA